MEKMENMEKFGKMKTIAKTKENLGKFIFSQSEVFNF